jgi:pyruvate/2-oxoglutarate dehydrogenase complex dihydrolipoamide acyltransferase (E2) component
LPADVDRYLAEHARTEEDTGAAYRERRLSAQQRALTFRFRRSAQLVIPATITCPVAWTSVERALQVVRADHPDVPVGSLEVIAYAVARGAGAHPSFRSVLVGDDRVREYPHLTLGIAVHRTEGDLVMAIIPQVDTMALPELARAV